MKHETTITEVRNRCGNAAIEFSYNGRQYMATVNQQTNEIIWLDRVEITYQLTRGTNEFTTPDRHYKSISMKSERAAKLVAALTPLLKVVA